MVRKLKIRNRLSQISEWVLSKFPRRADDAGLKDGLRWKPMWVSSKVFKVIVGVLLGAIGLAVLSLFGVTEASRSPGYCSRCHVMDPFVESTQSQIRLAYVHTQAGVTCQLCHPRTTATLVNEIVRTVTHTYPDPLAKVKFATQDCLQCHGSYAQLEVQTQHLARNPHYPMQGELECRTCHRVHADSIYYCGQCHDDGTLPKVGWVLPQP